MLMQTEGFADQSFDAIASNGVSYHSRRNRQPQASVGQAILARENGEVTIGEASRVLIDAIEFGFLPEAVCRCERPRLSLQASLSEHATRDSRLTPPDAYGPSHGDEQGSRGPNGSPCAHGSHAYVYGAGCSVDKCASCSNSPRNLR